MTEPQVCGIPGTDIGCGVALEGVADARPVRCVACSLLLCPACALSHFGMGTPPTPDPKTPERASYEPESVTPCPLVDLSVRRFCPYLRKPASGALPFDAELDEDPASAFAPRTW